jgi:hypothetical protein
VAQEIATYDLRSVANSLEERQWATRFFSRALSERLVKLPIRFVDYEKYFLCDVLSEEFQEKAMSGVLSDDVHGSLVFFRAAASRVAAELADDSLSA